jgi:hypothetical protein
MAPQSWLQRIAYEIKMADQGTRRRARVTQSRMQSSVESSIQLDSCIGIRGSKKGAFANLRSIVNPVQKRLDVDSLG